MCVELCVAVTGSTPSTRQHAFCMPAQQNATTSTADKTPPSTHRRRSQTNTIDMIQKKVMWKFLEQQSFHMTKEQYDAQMAAVADVVTEWGAADT